MNETKETKKVSRYQTFKMKAMRVLPTSLILSIAMVSSASANTSINFTGVTDTIDAVIPIFSSLSNLVVAIVPYILTLAIVGGLVALIKGLFNKGLKF